MAEKGSKRPVPPNGLWAAIRGLLRAILGQNAVSSLDARLERSGQVDEDLNGATRSFVAAAASGEPARSRVIATLPPETIEQAVQDAVSSMDPGARAGIEACAREILGAADGDQLLASITRAADALMSSSRVRHTLLSYADERLGLGKALAPGDRIDGRFRVIELLGRGGMGVVYRVIDEVRETEVALKVLAKEMLGSLEARRRFKEEVNLSLRLTHPNIVRAYDIGEVNGQLYMHMELMEGGTLAKVISGERLPVVEALALLRGMLEGLACAHQNGVLHLDVKPSNVLLGRTGETKLGDLGLARLLRPGRDLSIHAGEGTEAYMAPEQRKGARNLDARADVFAAGMVMYEVLTGELPAGVCEPLPLDVPIHVRDAVMRALSQDRARRQPDAGALLSEGFPAEVRLQSSASSLVASPVSPSEAHDPAVAPPSWSVKLVRGVLERVRGLLITGEGHREIRVPRGETGPWFDLLVRMGGRWFTLDLCKGEVWLSVPLRQVLLYGGWPILAEHPELVVHLMLRPGSFDHLVRAVIAASATSLADKARAGHATALKRQRDENWAALAGAMSNPQDAAWVGELVAGRAEPLPLERPSRGQAVLAAIEAMQDAGDAVGAAIVAQVLIGDRPRAIQCLSSLGRGAACEVFCEAAIVYWALLSDGGEARRCLEGGEFAAKNTRDWAKLASAWQQTLGDESQARRCIGRGEATAKDGFDWAELADVWWDTLGVQAQTLRCLERGEGVAKSGHQWARLAIHWHDTFGDDVRTRQCLDRGEDAARDALNWISLARARRMAFTDAAGARRCLDRGETAAKDGCYWASLADAWLDTLGDEARARHLLERGEASAEHSFDWTRLVLSWRDTLGDQARARECLERGEATAKLGFDWAMFAGAWLDYLGDETRARQCLDRGEIASKDGCDWASLAYAWFDTLGDEARARQCLDRGEAVADAGSDWASLAKAWKETLGDEARARQCLEQGEAATKQGYGWANLAEAWSKTLDDNAQAQRCLERGEAVAKSALQWAQLAKAWQRTLGDQARARRCLDRGKAVAQSGWDWACLAEALKEALRDQADARKCLELGEAAANDRDDWAELADQWEGLGNSTRAEACRRRAETGEK